VLDTRTGEMDINHPFMAHEQDMQCRYEQKKDRKREEREKGSDR